MAKSAFVLKEETRTLVAQLPAEEDDNCVASVFLSPLDNG